MPERTDQMGLDPDLEFTKMQVGEGKKCFAPRHDGFRVASLLTSLGDSWTSWTARRCRAWSSFSVTGLRRGMATGRTEEAVAAAEGQQT